MNLFTGMHNIASRDKTRGWGETSINTALFNPKERPTTSLQHPWELAELLEIYVKKRPVNVLELGVFLGGTLYWLMKHAAPGAKIGGIDYFDELIQEQPLREEDWRKWLRDWNEFKFWEGNTHDPIIQSSVSEYFENGIDFLFIDATHDYEDAKLDLLDYGKMVNPGGIICLHDIRTREMGTYKLWEEVRHAGYITQLLVADPYSTEVDAGIGVIYL